MSRTKIALISGAAVGLSAFAASAQTPNADAERAFSAELVADAESRSSLLVSGGSAGFTEGKGFGISSADGNNTLNVDAYIAFNYTINSGSETGTAPNDRENGLGFNQDNSRLTFHGNTINQDTHYKIQLKLEAGGNVVLEDVWVAYETESDITVAAGQFYVPLFHNEFFVAHDKQLSANRQIGTESFGAMRSQGIAAKYSADNFRVVGAITDGYQAQNSPAFTEGADFAITVRGDFFGAGSGDDFNHASSFRGSEQAWRLGGGFHYETGGETQGTTDQDITGFTVDGQFKGDGFQAGGGVAFLTIDPASGTEQEIFLAYAEGSYFLTNQLEGFGRYELIDVDNAALAEDSFSFLTFGANYFFVEGSYAARFIGEVTVALEQIPSAAGVASSKTGLIATGEDSQVVVKGQINISF